MNLPDRVTQGKVVINSSKVEQVERILAQHVSRLRVSLQHATGALSGPEEGSDAWLLLNALISSNDHPALLARFEQSGRAVSRVCNHMWMLLPANATKFSKMRR